MVTSPRIGVLALQGDVREHLRYLEQSGALAATVRRRSEIEEIDGLVIPGGESTTIYKLAEAFEVFDPIVKRIAAGIPVYGSCAGMIMLADELVDCPPDQRTFGGIDMAVRRNAFGRQVDSFETPVTLVPFPDDQFPGVFIRAPWVERIGPQTQVLGQVQVAGSGPQTSAGRIVAVRQGHLLATAFHPELTGDLRVHRYFVEMVRKAMSEQPTEG
jgi:pyridoxal 5'-phosphate synthase pdxT subunit